MVKSRFFPPTDLYEAGDFLFTLDTAVYDDGEKVRHGGLGVSPTKTISQVTCSLPHTRVYQVQYNYYYQYQYILLYKVYLILK